MDSPKNVHIAMNEAKKNVNMNDSAILFQQRLTNIMEYTPNHIQESQHKPTHALYFVY